MHVTKVALSFSPKSILRSSSSRTACSTSQSSSEPSRRIRWQSDDVLEVQNFKQEDLYLTPLQLTQAECQVCEARVFQKTGLTTSKGGFFCGDCLSLEANPSASSSDEPSCVSLKSEVRHGPTRLERQQRVEIQELEGRLGLAEAKFQQAKWVEIQELERRLGVAKAKIQEANDNLKKSE